MTNQENRSTILEYIFRNAPVARSTIAKQTQITPATVTSISGNFIQEGIIQEVGAEDNTTDCSPGRRKILLDIVPDRVYAIGVEFTSRHIRFSVCNLRGVAVLQSSFSAKETDNGNITDFITEKVKAILEENPSFASSVIGIGIAVPGHMDTHQDKVITNSSLCPQFSGEVLRKRLNIPIICENNVRCMAFGRYLFDASSPDTFAYFHVGAGMFCALIENSKLFQGTNYYAGEIGHTIVNPNGKKCECGKYGCLQTYCSETWLLKYCRLLYESNADTILPSLKPCADDLTVEDISNAFSLGDTLVGNYISTALKYLGITVSNLAIITNPNKIYLHGNLFSNTEIKEELMDYITQQLLFVDDPSDQTVQILDYDTYAGALGAAAYAIKHFYISNI